MTAKLVLAAMGLYLALVARSAWKQGQLRDFLRSLVFVAALLGGLALIVEAYIWLDTHR